MEGAVQAHALIGAQAREDVIREPRGDPARFRRT
jgi:hypothetical protein